MLIATVALLALAGLTGGVGAADGENAGESEGEMTGAAVSAVTNSINYQGRLTDSSGSPLTGTYNMTFGLYKVSTGGTALATDTHDVDITDGLFNTDIDFDQSYFDGRELWLGVAVGTDSEMTPRQELRSVPYALSLRPGARIIGSSPVALYVKNAAARSYGVYAYTSGVSSHGVYAHTYGDHSKGVYACTSGNRSGGVSAYTSGVSSHGVSAFTSGNRSGGVRASTTGYNSDGVSASTFGNDSDGVYAYTQGDDSYGFYAYTTGDSSHGFYASTFGDYSEGVRALSAKSYGVYAHTDSADSAGVYALGKDGGADLILGGNANTAAGDDGKIYSDPAYDSSDIYLITNDGLRIDLDNDGDGEDADFEIRDKDDKTIFDVDNGGNVGIGLTEPNRKLYVVEDVSGVAYPLKLDNPHPTYNVDAVGILFSTGGSGGGPIDTDRGKGALVYEYKDTWNRGSFHFLQEPNTGEANPDLSDAVMTVQNNGNVGIGTTSPREKLTVIGNVLIASESTGMAVVELGEGLDYAEGFDVSDTEMIGPGTVLIIDPDNPGKLTLSNTPYDTKVAGIVAGANETGSGVRLGADQFDYDVALAGRVYCNVDATEEGVEPGDMLTTSATPGYAMKSTDYERAHGAILGKAMQRLENGQKGQILVLVALQ
jgi:hypothetical protein